MSDVLVVTSKVKKYLADEHDLRTSGDVAAFLSNHLEGLLDGAADAAKAAGVVTVKADHFKQRLAAAKEK